MTNESVNTSTTISKELLLFASLFFFGLVVLPIAIFFVGDAIFGEFGGDGIGGFYGDVLGRLASGEASAWFLVLSPYLVWQLLRLSIKAFRSAGGG
jgi:cobalamin synthase